MTAIPTFSVRVKPEHQDLIRGVARVLKEQPEQADALRQFLGQTASNTHATRMKYDLLEERIQGLEEWVRELADKIQLLEPTQDSPSGEPSAIQVNTDALQTRQPDSPERVGELLVILAGVEQQGMTLEAMAGELNRLGWLTQNGLAWNKSNLFLWRKKQRGHTG